MNDIPLRDELETTLKKVAKEIRKRVHRVKAPKSLETPLKQSIEAVHNAVVFGRDIVAKKSGRKKKRTRKTSTKKPSAKKANARKTIAKTSARKATATKPGTKQRSSKKRSRTKSVAKQFA